MAEDVGEESSEQRQLQPGTGCCETYSLLRERGSLDGQMDNLHTFSDYSKGLLNLPGRYDYLHKVDAVDDRTHGYDER